MWKYFVIFLLFLIILLIYNLKTIPNSQKIEVFLDNPNHQLINSIEKINLNLERINCLHYKKIKIHLIKGIFFKAKAYLFFKKDKNLRFVIENALGKQIDIGSNNEIFWFWSRHMSPAAYYFSKHENLNKTNLKVALSPDWILESINLKKIDFKDSFFIKNKNYKGIRQLKLGPSGEKISVITFIDTVNNIVKERYLCDEKDNIIVSIEYKSYVSIENVLLPECLNVCWYQEDVFMEWTISGVELNSTIENYIWEIPNNNKIDIAL